MAATGCDALNAELQRCHPGLTPVRLEGPEGSPVRWVEAWPAESPPHWHLVTFGLTDLEVSDMPSRMSGWGQELTLRVARGAEPTPPEWAVALLHELARKVLRFRQGFEDEETLDIDTDAGGMHAVVMTKDATLSPLRTVNGRVAFMQAVGLTGEELDLEPSEVLEALKAEDPLLLTRPGRVSRWARPPPPPIPERAAGESEALWAWRRIERWLEAQQEGLSARLAPGATVEALEAAERKMGVRLPEDVRESYLRHDGEQEFLGLFLGWTQMSLRDVQKEWAFERWEERAPRSRGPVKAQSWSPRWIAMIANGAGDFLCVDLDPPEEGTAGQLILVHHDDPERIRMTRSLTSWLTRFADRLEAGDYAYAEDRGIYPREDEELDDLIEP
jgi:cell wall assembly regulator SMI1